MQSDWVTTSTILERLRDFEDVPAWDRLVHRFRAPIMAFSRRLGLPEDAAEDVAQETLTAFADAHRRGLYRRERGRLSKFLFGIAWRQASRARQRAGRRDARENGGATLDELPADAVSRTWDEEWEAAMLARCLERVRAEVAPSTFRAFELVVRSDRPAEDVARELGVPVKLVYNAKHRVLRRIRRVREELEGIT